MLHGNIAVGLEGSLIKETSVSIREDPSPESGNKEENEDGRNGKNEQDQANDEPNELALIEAYKGG